MGKTLEDIPPDLADWIQQQPVFFVATAPLSGDGHVNCSPKGMDSLRVLDFRTVAYADLAGSGIETVAHLQENGRIVLMLCAFHGPPKIVRLHGTGHVIFPDSPDFPELLSQFPELPGVRSIIRVSVQRVSTTCGFGVPRMQFQEGRETLREWADKKGPEAIQDYIQQKNAHSIDGLPGVSRATASQ
jgi:hypothetical protein